MKSKGSSTDSCGTPYVIGNLFELLSFMLKERFQAIYLVSFWFHNGLVCGEVYNDLQCQMLCVDQWKCHM